MPSNVICQDVFGRQKRWTIGELYIKWTKYLTRISCSVYRSMSVRIKCSHLRPINYKKFFPIDTDYIFCWYVNTKRNKRENKRYMYFLYVNLFENECIYIFYFLKFYIFKITRHWILVFYFNIFNIYLEDLLSGICHVTFLNGHEYSRFFRRVGII